MRCLKTLNILLDRMQYSSDTEATSSAVSRNTGNVYELLLIIQVTVLCKSNKSELRRISLIVLANFQRCSRDNSTKVRRNFARSLENSQSKTKYRRSEFFNSRKLEEISLKRNEISANCPAVKARSRGFRDFIYYIQKRLFTNRNL